MPQKRIGFGDASLRADPPTFRGTHHATPAPHRRPRAGRRPGATTGAPALQRPRPDRVACGCPRPRHDPITPESVHRAGRPSGLARHPGRAPDHRCRLFQLPPRRRVSLSGQAGECRGADSCVDAARVVRDVPQVDRGADGARQCRRLLVHRRGHHRPRHGGTAGAEEPLGHTRRRQPSDRQPDR